MLLTRIIDNKKVKKSAKGCAAAIPVTKNILEKINIIGIKNIPCFANAKIEALIVCLVV